MIINHLLFMPVTNDDISPFGPNETPFTLSISFIKVSEKANNIFKNNIYNLDCNYKNPDIL